MRTGAAAGFLNFLSLAARMGTAEEKNAEAARSDETSRGAEPTQTGGGGGVWTKFDIFLDRSHLRLRGHETAFLTALCLFCTCLCVFVTDRHLALEWRVASVEAELARLQEAAPPPPPPPQLQPPALTRERRSAAEAADQEQEARTGMSNGQF